jgi:BirA family biotin operon repressor/biotin-[acetyl-CoA-carboxylase] ligase
LNGLLLNTLFCGQNHLHFKQINSTNTEAQKLCKSGEVAEGLLVTTEIQENGRGYAGNTWRTEPGKNVTMTLVLKPSFLNAKRQFLLNKAVTLAIYDVLKQELDEKRLRIKWPNDIVYDGTKLCGILIENTLQAEMIQYSFIGIGLNVNQDVFPPELKYAGSLKKVTGKEYELNKIISALCEHIEARYLQLRNNNLTTLDEEYIEHLFRFDSLHDYVIGGKKIKGKITGLTPEGKLLLDTEEGQKECGFKEIEFVTPSQPSL